jgi:hypothetical protein
VGKAEKWRSPFLGVGLAMRCERSEHGKSQLSKKFLHHLFLLFPYYSQSYPLRCPKMTDNLQIDECFIL